MATDMAGPRPAQDRSRGRPLARFVVPVLLMVGVVWAFIVLSNRAPGLDDDLCPNLAADLAGRTVALFDFRKPLDPEHRGLPARLLREIAERVPGRGELRTYILSGEAAEPRVFLGRFCKPGSRGAGRTARGAPAPGAGCDALPDASGVERPPAMDGFCARRDALAARLDLLAAAERGGPVRDAFLVEALEDTRLELAAAPGAKALYVLSDMIQHADWYSHLDLPPEEWDFPGFADLREAEAALFGAPPPLVAGLRGTLFYIPRRGVTDAVDARTRHRTFWQAYFRGSVAFEDQPVMAAYAAEPLMGQLTELEVATREQERLARERERADLLREQLERENAALAEARARAATERRELDAQQARWEADRAEEQRRMEAERAEVERLRAELEARRDAR